MCSSVLWDHISTGQIHRHLIQVLIQFLSSGLCLTILCSSHYTMLPLEWSWIFSRKIVLVRYTTWTSSLFVRFPYAAVRLDLVNAKFARTVVRKWAGTIPLFIAFLNREVTQWRFDLLLVSRMLRSEISSERLAFSVSRIRMRMNVSQWSEKSSVTVALAWLLLKRLYLRV